MLDGLSMLILGIVIGLLLAAIGFTRNPGSGAR